MEEEDQALERALQLAYDARTNGQPVLFNPPSQQDRNVQQNDLMYYSKQVAPIPEPREELERKLDPRDMERLSVQGVMLPNKAVDVRHDDQGSYPVDASGNRLDWVRRPAMLPVTMDQGELRAAMPYFLEQAGNMLSGVVPVQGVGTILGSGPIRKAGQVAAEAAQGELFAPTVQKASSVAPEGNLAMRPSVTQYDLKGPETQTVESFLNQLKNMPGVPRETIDDIALRFYQNPEATDLSQTMSKADFEKMLPSSKYNKVDLKQAATDPDEHLFLDAERMANDEPEVAIEDMLLNMGARWHPGITDDAGQIMDVYAGIKSFEELPDETRKLLERNGVVDADSLMDNAREYIADYTHRIFEELRANVADDIEVARGDSGYTYETYQRLIPEFHRAKRPQDYVEMGVTHPDQKTSYRHYPGHSGDPLVAHFRGQSMPEGGPILTSNAFKQTSGISEAPSTIRVPPKSFIIEELQSDVQKNIAQSGPTLNAHATAFKAAVQHALENGAQTVYYPTSKVIAAARSMEPQQFASIYDKEVMKFGVNPLLKIPGVTAEKVGGDYIKLDFQPQAIKYILEGPGQRLTNYDNGGAVKYEGEVELEPLQEPSGKRFMDRALGTGLQSENVEFPPRVSRNWNEKWEEAVREKYGPMGMEFIPVERRPEPGPVSRGRGSTPERTSIDDTFTRTSQYRVDPEMIKKRGPRFAQDVQEMMYTLEKEGTRTPRAEGGRIEDKYASLDFSDVLPLKFG
jgi:hypothetical protein